LTNFGDETDRRELALFALFFLSFAALGLVSEGTFTDDDISRFMAAQVVFEFPEKFVGLWTRPAAMVLYALPAQLGYWAVELLTALACALTCLFTYRSARHLGEARPHFAALFTALQPFFLLLSFSALTEPLAALLLAIAVERLLAGKATSSAIWASLIPLARLEFALVLGLWAIYLVARRAWTSLLWLPFGLLLWSTAAFFLNGDFLFLLHSTFVERERGREALDFWHYAKGSVFVVGPTVFFFAVLGWISGLSKKRYLVVWPAIVVMMAYYTFSSVRSGSLQSAGYFRHLVSLSPLFALLGLRGLNAWFGERHLGRADLVRIAAMIGIPVACWFFLSVDLLNRYIVGDTSEYWKFGIVTTLAGLGLALAFRPRVLAHRIVMSILQVAIVAISLTYFFVKDGPIPLTNEKQVIREAASWCIAEGIDDRQLLTNHEFVHFLLGANPAHVERFPKLNSVNLENAPVSSLAIWEGHYGHALAGGVDLAELETLRSYRVHRRILGPKHSYFAVILEKVTGGESVKLDENGYRHSGLGVHWDFGTASDWTFTASTEKLSLLKGRSLSQFRVSLDLARFLRIDHSTDSFGSSLATALASASGFRILKERLDPARDWYWISGESSSEAVVIGVHAARERHIALKLVATGPRGSLSRLEASVIPLAHGLSLEAARTRPEEEPG